MPNSGHWIVAVDPGGCPGRISASVQVEPPLCFPRFRNGTAGLRARHDCCPLSNG
ncbi:hypothetical protein G3I77_33525 [Streptomyces sp. D2-8]|nr:hypothetical protein [Streptomyces sp. D2-8]